MRKTKQTVLCVFEEEGKNILWYDAIKWQSYGWKTWNVDFNILLIEVSTSFKHQTGHRILRTA